MPAESKEFLIRGLTRAGNRFRPSDWAERLCGVMAQCGGDGRTQYSPYVIPIVSEGVKCVLVNRELKERDAMAYRFVVNFAHDNDLEMREGRTKRREESPSKQPG